MERISLLTSNFHWSFSVCYSIVKKNITRWKFSCNLFVFINIICIKLIDTVTIEKNEHILATSKHTGYNITPRSWRFRVRFLIDKRILVWIWNQTSHYLLLAIENIDTLIEFSEMTNKVKQSSWWVTASGLIPLASSWFGGVVVVGSVAYTMSFRGLIEQYLKYEHTSNLGQVIQFNIFCQLIAFVTRKGHVNNYNKYFHIHIITYS